MEKATTCKYCGKTAIGRPASETSTIKKMRTTCRWVGATSSALRMDLVSAWGFASGKYEDGMEKAGTNLMGGVLYHFKCTNPECGQCFDKMVL